MARILLAEDDDNLRRFLGRGLTRAGHTVLSAPDGDAAFALVLKAPVDLLLADVVMPGLDGIELARRATIRWPRLRVMFITGFAAVALRNREIGHQTAAVLAKTVPPPPAGGRGHASPGGLSRRLFVCPPRACQPRPKWVTCPALRGRVAQREST